jgi:hypothetical protein
MYSSIVARNDEGGCIAHVINAHYNSTIIKVLLVFLPTGCFKCRDKVTNLPERRKLECPGKLKVFAEVIEFSKLF